MKAPLSLVPLFCKVMEGEGEREGLAVAPTFRQGAPAPTQHWPWKGSPIAASPIGMCQEKAAT